MSNPSFKEILVNMHGIMIIQMVKRIQSVRKSPMHGDCMTCTATSGNGFRMFITIVTMAHPLTAAHGKGVAPPVSFGAVAGATTSGTAGQRFASTTSLSAATALSAFAF